MKYLFILGRDPELSLIEIESFLSSREISFKIIEKTKEVLVLESNLNPQIIHSLGGTVKIAGVIAEGDILRIESQLDHANIYNGKKNKITYFISYFDTELNSFLEGYLKDYFRSIKVKAYYKKSKRKYVNNIEPTRILQKGFPENAIEFVVFKNYIARTLSVYNPKELQKRDLERPCHDFLKSISLRLAKIMINISKIKPKQVLLDPFCGVGTILQEALIQNINVIGTDIDKELIKKSEKNIKWAIRQYRPKSNFKLIACDCQKLSEVLPKDSINAVVSEPFQGPYLKVKPNLEKAKEITRGLSLLYTKLFYQLNFLIKANSRIVIIIPHFTIYKKRINVLFKMPENFKIKVVLPYFKPKSVIEREIFVIEKI